LRAARGGSRALLTVGRVQTPTLNLVVQRDKDIETFKAIPFHTIHAKIKHENGTFVASWKAKEEQAGLDS
jgi:DNA topoisomerase-3